MNEERIDSLINIQAVEKELTTVAKELDSIISKMETIAKSGQSVTNSLGGGNMKETAKAMEQLNKTTQDAAKANTDYANSTTKLNAVTKQLTDEEKALERQRKAAVRSSVQLSDANKTNRETIAKNKAEIRDLNQELSIAANKQRSLTEFQKMAARQMNLATASVGEMQAELSRLNRMSFAGLNPKQIDEVKAKMALLKEEIGDFNARIAASGDKTKLMISGLQGVVAVAQGVTSTLAAFGVENKKLQQTMIALISASQALATIHDLREKAIFKEIAATIRSTFNTTKDTIATWANVQAKNASTKAASGLFKVIAANPMLALAAGVAAVTVGIIALINAIRPAKTNLEQLADSQKDVFEEAGTQAGKLETLAAKIKLAGNNEKLRSQYIKEYNELAKAAGVNTLDYSASIDELNAAISENTKLLFVQSAQRAAQNEMDKVTTDLIRLRSALSKAEREENEFVVGAIVQQIRAREADFDELVRISQATGYYLSQQKSGINLTASITKGIKASTSATTEATSATTEATTEVQKYTAAMMQADKAGGEMTEAISRGVSELGVNITATATHITGVADKMIIETNSKTLEGLAALFADGLITYEDYQNGIITIATEKASKIKEIQDKAFTISDTVLKAGDAYVSLMNALADADIQKIDKQTNAQIEALDQRLAAGLITQAQYDLQKRGIEENAAERTKKIQNDEAKRQKAFAVFQATIDTAKAIIGFLSMTPVTPLNLALSAFAALTGGLQIAAITAAPLPAYAKGREGGDAEMAIVGERGRELIVDGDKAWLTPDTASLTYLPKGADVIPHHKLGDNGLLKGINGLRSDLKNKEFIKINITEKGLQMVSQRGYNKQTYINKHLRK